MHQTFWLKIAFLMFVLGAPSDALARVMLVIDGSGSMWGQVEGKAKIVAVREGIDRMIRDLEVEPEVGLIVYGHREKGNCKDIEELVPLGPLNKDAFRAAIAGINPKGKTPLSDAIQQAANSLRFVEEKARVVIVSDGQESCDKDPCALAEELERLGVDFQVDSIALDISDEEGMRQLTCIAQNTGGAVYPIENLAQIETVFEEVVQPIVEEAALTSGMRLVATTSSGTPPAGDIEWTLIDQATEETTIFEAPSGALRDMPPGRYELFVRAGDLLGETIIDHSGESVTEVVVNLGTGGIARGFTAPATASGGSLLTFDWAGPAAEGDLIFIARPDLNDSSYPLDEERRHRADEGSPARLVAPAEAGTFEIRYFSFKNGEVLIRQPLEIAAPDVTLEGPAQALAGGVADVVWTGPQAPGDIIFFAEPGWENNFVPLDRDYQYSTAAGSPAELKVPAKPGAYELRYFSGANATTLLRIPIEVVLASATVDAPDSVAAGAAFEVTFTGPQHQRDVVFVAPADLDTSRYYAFGGSSREARGASSASLVAPAEPGRYEVRYFSPDHGGLLARSAFDVTEADVAIEAPRTAAAGSTIDIQIKGPGAPGDLVFIAERSWQPNQFPFSRADSHEVGRGSTATLPVPARPDTYEIRYFSHGNGTTLARRTLVVR